MAPYMSVPACHLGHTPSPVCINFYFLFFYFF
jgi:hypothetical protein